MKRQSTLAVDPNLPVLVESEVAYYLRQHLGPIMVWPFLLTNLRRAGNSDELLPYVFSSNRRYYYAFEDVVRFAERFAEECPDAKPNVGIVPALAGDVEPNSQKRRIRRRNDGFVTIKTKAAKPATLH